MVNEAGQELGAVGAKADRVPRSFCHTITILSRFTGEAGNHLIRPSVIGGRSKFKIVMKHLFE
jgi:hypothetical protein